MNNAPTSLKDPSGRQIAIPVPVPICVAAPEICVILGGLAVGGTIIYMARGNSDPSSGLEPFNPGRDCDGKCNPCPPNQMWTDPGDAHGSTGGVHYHGIVWNQAPDCTCYPNRVSGSSPGDMK